MCCRNYGKCEKIMHTVGIWKQNKNQKITLQKTLQEFYILSKVGIKPFPVSI